MFEKTKKLVLYVMSPLIHLFKLTIAFSSLIPWSTVSMLIGIFNQNSGIKLLRLWIRFFLAMFNVTVIAENENDSQEYLTGCIFTLLNQTSLLDGPIGILVYPLPCRGLANIEYTLIPFFGWCMWIFGWVIIRQIPEHAKRTMNHISVYLKNKGNLWLSIEGRRSTSGKLSLYKKGPVVLAIKAQAKIVPVFIHGAKNCIGTFGQYNKKKTVIVRMLKVIRTEGLTYEDRNELVSHLYELGTNEILNNQLLKSSST